MTIAEFATPFALRHHLPDSQDRLRQGLYAGEVYLLGANAASAALVLQVQSELIEALGNAPRLAQHRMDNDAFFARLGPLRRRLYTEPKYHEALREVVRAMGFDPASVAVDPLRLRVVRSRGDVQVPAAKAVYYPHRDTWYAHPQALLTWWIPMDDLDQAETFVFYPERFRQEVPNDSEAFDYDAWVRDGWDLKIGWQNPNTGTAAHYPGALGTVAGGPSVGFSCKAAQNLLFSGAHFHQTLPQASGQTRFSLDFRVVHLGDHAAGMGAPNVDARSRGSALRDYLRWTE